VEGLLREEKRWREQEKARWGDFSWVEARQNIDHANAIRDGLISPPWMKRRQEDEGPQVRFAKELLRAKYLQGEWRTMTIKAVRNDCADEAKARGKRLPSLDSFARAMGRRRRPE
jgi:hypothetical protein